MKFESSAPIFTVNDVAATMRWYEDVLGFHSNPFPANPPYVFGIMNRSGVEIMLQRLEGYAKPNLYDTRPGGVWDLYVRLTGIRELYDAIVNRGDVPVLEPLHRQPYHQIEFVIRDPNGYVLVFGEET